MNDRMQAEVEELPENRVRLTVQVPSHDVHHAFEHATTDLAERVKIPGFRKGKVPHQVLVQKIGRDRIATEAVGLNHPFLGERSRHARIAVHPSLEVELRVGVSTQHVEAHRRPSLRDPAHSKLAPSTQPGRGLLE